MQVLHRAHRDVVREAGAAGTELVGPEIHELVDHELRAAVEQVVKRAHAARCLKFVFVLELHHR
jgi:hypothetical protein